MLVLITLECLVITPFNLLFIQYISIQASAQKVKSLCFTNTLYSSTIHPACIIAYRSHYRHTVETRAILLTTHRGVGRASPSRSEYTDSRSHSGGINLISTAQSLGCQKLLSRVALTSNGVDGLALPKKFAAQSFALVRVADGRLVIPWEGEDLPCSLIILLYCYVVGVKVCFCRIHTFNEDVHNAQVRILP
jgi:hypothetical protein